MKRARLFSAAAVLLTCLVGGTPAQAELVFFQSGRALSVKSYRFEGENLVLTLRSGGEISCSGELIARIEPDEVEYPEDVLAAMPVAPALVIEPPAIPEEFRDIISVAAARHGVDARLVHALIQVESAYHSNARSPKGAMGLMQLMPSTARQYGALNLYDPKTNIETGIRHLKTLLNRFSELPLALAAYNAGQGAVEKFGGIPPFKETREYVSKILRLLNHA
jgi:soluble lytic murein transglycosylase-like protein